MGISITTTSDGHLILYIIDNSGFTILQLKDTDNGSAVLVSGNTYRFEWHVWSPAAADYSIQANVHPDNPGFLPFNYSRKYATAHRDMGGFYFTV